MTKQGADLSIADLRVEFFAIADSIYEVGEVQNVAGRLAFGFHFLSSEVVDGVLVSSGHGKSAVVTIKNHERQCLMLALEATALVPEGGAVAKVEQRCAGVGRFLVIVKVVPSNTLGRSVLAFNIRELLRPF